MNILLIFLFLLLVALVLQIDLKGKCTYNAISNTGHLEVRLFCFRIINLRYSIKKGYIEFLSKNSQKFLPIDFSPQTIKEVSKLDDFIFSKIYFKKISVFINIGIKDKAFETALLSGFLNTILISALTILKNAKSEVLEMVKIYNEFNKDEFNINVKCKISISIIDLIWCFVENIAYKQIYRNTIKNNEQTSKER